MGNLIRMARWAPTVDPFTQINPNYQDEGNAREEEKFAREVWPGGKLGAEPKKVGPY